MEKRPRKTKQASIARHYQIKQIYIKGQLRTVMVLKIEALTVALPSKAYFSSRQIRRYTRG